VRRPAISELGQFLSARTSTVNIDPLPVTKEISKEEKAHDRVAGDYSSEKKISLLTVMEKKQRKIAALMQGQTIPFNASFTIRVWDKTREGLNAKTGATRNLMRQQIDIHRKERRERKEET